MFLASQSPRRRTLLSDAGIAFEPIEPGHTDERAPAELAPTRQDEQIALVKARSVRAGGVILAADTIAVLDGRIFGKPRNPQDAFEMLKTLQGTTHEVITGVALVDGDRERLFHEVSRVTLEPLSDDEIRRYHEAVDPLDKAGACGIQETAGILRVRIEGSESNVMGLPIERLRGELRDFLI